jgi:hypothetical protein
MKNEVGAVLSVGAAPTSFVQSRHPNTPFQRISYICGIELKQIVYDKEKYQAVA